MKTNHKYSLLFAFCISVMNADFMFAQPIYNPPANFYTIKAAEQARFHTIVYPDSATKREDMSRYQLWVRQWEPVLYPSGDFLPAYKAMADLVKVRQTNLPQQILTSSSIANWTELGPFDMPSISPACANMSGPYQCDATVLGLGRLQSISFDKSQNPQTIFTCSATGGLWYSTNGGGSWLNGGTDFLPEAAVSYCVADPNNNSNWFLSTGDGEGFFNSSSPNPESWSASIGIYRKMGSGFNWQLIGNATQLGASNGSGGNLSGWQIKKILTDPADGNILYAVTSFGIFKSTNALTANPSNVTWSKLPTSGHDPNDGHLISNDDPNNWFNHPFYDIEIIKPTTSANYVIYAAKDANSNGNPGPIQASIIMSTDKGLSWTTITNGIGNMQNYSRIDIEVSPHNPDIAYAALNSSLYKFNFGSLTWTFVNNLPGGIKSQALGVSPTNENIIIVGNVQPMYRTTDGGQTWNNLPPQTHNDIHHIVFTPDGSTIWAATDGGNYKSTDGGSSWQGQNSGLAVATVCYVAGAETNPNEYIESTYDDGSILFNGSNWTQELWGDGQNTKIDYKDDKTMYVSHQAFASANMYRSDDQGTTINNVSPNLPISTWETQFDMNVSNPNILFLANQDVWRTMDKGVSWQQISNFSLVQFHLTDPVNYRLWRVYSAPSNPDYLYCHVLDNPTRLFKTSIATSTPANVITSWTEITLPANRWPSDIKIDDDDPEIFWLTFGGFNLTQKIWKYNGHTNQWTDITADIVSVVGADVSVGSIVKEKGSDDGLYIQTNAGVYYTNNAFLASTTGAKWQPFNQGLPNVDMSYIFSSLEINYTSNKIRAATFGRGLWESSLFCPTNTDLTFSNTSISGFQEAKNNIYVTASANNIANSGNLALRAGNLIDVTAINSHNVDFTPATYTHLFIHGCDHPGNSFRQMATSSSVPDVTAEAAKETKPITEGDNFKFTYYPNPFTDHLHIDFMLEKESPVLVSIYTPQGQLIQTLAQGTYEAGEHTLVFDNPVIKPGLYFVRLDMGDRHYAKAVIKSAE